jgi:hypothetical protein
MASSSSSSLEMPPPAPPATDASTSRAESPRFNVRKSVSTSLFDVPAINTGAGANPAIDSKRNFWLGSDRKDNLIEFMKVR